MNVWDKMEEMIVQQEHQPVSIFQVHFIVNVIMVILEMELLVSVRFSIFFSFLFLFPFFLNNTNKNEIIKSKNHKK